MNIGEALVGQLVDGRYRLVRLLGEGAFGLVFEAEHVVGTQVLARVAVKLLRHRIGGDTAQYAELQRGLQLNHANVVRCYSVGDSGVRLNGRTVSILFVAMELAASTLEERLKQSRLGHGDASTLAADVASGLAYLQEQQVSHRDIKPSNVLLVGGRWKISDFGVSAPLDDGQTAVAGAAGTLAYQPPESLEDKVSPVGDSWSFGAMLLEALTGQLPFDASTRGEWLYLLKTAEPKIPPGLPAPFDRIVEGCLRRDRTDRLSPRQVLDLLHAQRATAEPQTKAYSVVAPTGGHYESVVEAVRRAAPWSRVLVKPGTYVGSVVLDKPLELIALGASADVVIDGGDEPALVVDTADGMVRGFTFVTSGAAVTGKAVVEIRSGQSVVDLCEVRTAAKPCLFVWGRDARPVVRRCRFIGGRHEGVVFAEGAEGVLDSCEMRSAPRAGVAIRDKANPLLRRCQIVEPGFRGLHAGDKGRGVVEDCRIDGGTGPAIELARDCQVILRRVQVTAGGDVGVQANGGAKAIVADCIITAPEGRDWKLANGHQVQRLWTSSRVAVAEPVLAEHAAEATAPETSLAPIQSRRGASAAAGLRLLGEDRFVAFLAAAEATDEYRIGRDFKRQVSDGRSVESLLLEGDEFGFVLEVRASGPRTFQIDFGHLRGEMAGAGCIWDVSFGPAGAVEGIWRHSVWLV
ncbi:MAG: protein kinase [Acidobacteria bacterium]|nr:protein kinase [Acidobacteriota bacterium]